MMSRLFLIATAAVALSACSGQSGEWHFSKVDFAEAYPDEKDIFGDTVEYSVSTNDAEKMHYRPDEYESDSNAFLGYSCSPEETSKAFSFATDGDFKKPVTFMLQFDDDGKIQTVTSRRGFVVIFSPDNYLAEIEEAEIWQGLATADSVSITADNTDEVFKYNLKSMRPLIRKMPKGCGLSESWSLEQIKAAEDKL